MQNVNSESFFVIINLMYFTYSYSLIIRFALLVMISYRRLQ